VRSSRSGNRKEKTCVGGGSFTTAVAPEDETEATTGTGTVVGPPKVGGSPRAVNLIGSGWGGEAPSKGAGKSNKSCN